MCACTRRHLVLFNHPPLHGLYSCPALLMKDNSSVVYLPLPGQRKPSVFRSQALKLKIHFPHALCPFLATQTGSEVTGGSTPRGNKEHSPE